MAWKRTYNVLRQCTWRVFLQVPVWRQDTRWGADDILTSNTGRTFYQRLHVRASVVDVWWSLVQFLCLVGGCSTAKGWWDVNRQSLNLLTMYWPVQSTRGRQFETHTRQCGVVRHQSFTSVRDCSRDAEALATEDVRNDRLSRCWRWYLRFVLSLYYVLPGIYVLCNILSYNFFTLDNCLSRTVVRTVGTPYRRVRIPGPPDLPCVCCHRIKTLLRELVVFI